MTFEAIPQDSEFLNLMKTKMHDHPVMHHRFLTEFEARYLSPDQMRRFAIQWYKTARAHKIAFPSLIYNIPDDDVRFELVIILLDEYGNGDRDKIHAKLLRNFLTRLGISDEEIENTPTLPAADQFSKEILGIWKDGNPVYAFGLHFALEYLAAGLHTHFSDGLAKYDFLSDSDREYFDYHKIAEQNHSDYSEYGIVYYSADPANHSLLEAGVDKGIELLGYLWDEFYAYVFVDDEAEVIA